MIATFPVPTSNPGDVWQASWINTYIKNNEAYLLNRPAQTILRDNGANYTYAVANTFVAIDSTNLTITLANKGSFVWLFFNGAGTNSATNPVDFDFTMDGTRIGAAGLNGLWTAQPRAAAAPMGISYAALVAVTPGSHVFKPVWTPQAGTATLYSGAGSAGTDYLVQFGAVEVA